MFGSARRRGASAARGLLGRTVSVEAERGRWIALEDGSHLLITTHPAYLLRLGEGAAAETARFAADLAMVAQQVSCPKPR